MLGDKVEYDVKPEFEDNNYKSCFARSVVVNSQHQQEKQSKRQLHNQGVEHRNRGESATFIPQTNTKERFGGTSFASDSRRSSACSSRIAEMPIENLLLKSQIETLQWQLKQTESSKEMYREVMVQVVKFLERAYRSLQILGSKVPSSSSVLRAQSDFHMDQMLDSNVDRRRSTVPAIDAYSDYTTFRDFTRRQKNKQQPPDEIPPEKLSQEAFRLLRTAQSLLSTGAPDLAQMKNDTSEDLQFLEQLAKEFPREQENGTHRPASRCSSSLQVCNPHKEIRISTAFNRKLSLHQNLMSKRNSFHFDMLPSSTLNEDCCSSQASFTIENRNRKFKLEKSSPPMSSVSSAEDESGFSSMNSFQELGIPLINSTVIEEKKESSGTSSSTSKTDYDLWQTSDSKPTPPTNHKRWNSTPTETEKPLKVLWV